MSYCPLVQDAFKTLVNDISDSCLFSWMLFSPLTSCVASYWYSGTPGLVLGISIWIYKGIIIGIPCNPIVWHYTIPDAIRFDPNQPLLLHRMLSHYPHIPFVFLQVFLLVVPYCKEDIQVKVAMPPDVTLWVYHSNSLSSRQLYHQKWVIVPVPFNHPTYLDPH